MFEGTDLRFLNNLDKAASGTLKMNEKKEGCSLPGPFVIILYVYVVWEVKQFFSLFRLKLGKVI